MKLRILLLALIFLGASGCQTTSSTTTETTGSVPLPGQPAADKAATFSWNASTGVVQGYKIEASVNGTDYSELGTVGSNQLSVTVNGLYANVKYYFRVRGYNQGSNSAYSPVVTIKL